MNSNSINTAHLSVALHGDTYRILIATVLLTGAAVSSAAVVVKTIFAVLAICVLLWNKGTFSHTPASLLSICLAASIGIITVCSKSSFLYPFNDWVDANCFFTVGKGMMNGLVVYRDLLEQKGPVLYFIHGLAWLVSNDTFIGIYLVEIWAAAFFLFYSYRSIRLFVDSEWSVVLIPIYAVIIYTSKSFCHGDSVEELTLPFLAYAMYIGIDSIRNKRNITTREFCIIGATSGLIFWSKFTLIGFYVGWYLFPAVRYIRNGRWKELLFSAVAVFSGVVAVTVPFLVYFGINSAISDWLTVYLYNNLFLYSSVATQSGILPEWLMNILRGIWSVLRNDPLIPVMSLIGFLYFWRRRAEIALFVAVTAAFTVSFTYMGGRFSPYYAFIVNLFLPCGFLPVLEIFKTRNTRKTPLAFRKRFLTGIIVLCIVISYLLTPNRYLLGVNKDELPQFKFGNIIGTDGSATLLNYGFLDGGFHTVTNTLPNCKVFCKLNISPEQMQEAQDLYVKQGRCDYIITRNQLLDSANYKCISVCHYFFENADYTYYLYQLQH